MNYVLTETFKYGKYMYMKLNSPSGDRFIKSKRGIFKLRQYPVTRLEYEASKFEVLNPGKLEEYWLETRDRIL